MSNFRSKNSLAMIFGHFIWYSKKKNKNKQTKKQQPVLQGNVAWKLAPVHVLS